MTVIRRILVSWFTSRQALLERAERAEEERDVELACSKKLRDRMLNALNTVACLEHEKAHLVQLLHEQNQLYDSLFLLTKEAFSVPTARQDIVERYHELTQPRQH
ncbi:hypothetical protein [uncultured Fibrella sp.]|uniref:hypothetical protein n=1 Tax=uncultured Fibrella sp. TaxID=1284596 RepID=UPI0035CA1499